MTTHKLLLFGYPVAHSRSPAIHNAALQSVGLAGWSYAAQAVPPDELPQAVAQLRQPEYVGANVTIPHKERILPLLNRLTPAAQAIGAVNTVFKDGEALVGDNTDAPAFLADLQRHLVEQAVSLLYRGKVIVLGAGGSARAVVYALHHAGWQITLAARRLEQAQSIASRYPSGSVKAVELDAAAISTALLSTEYPGTLNLLVNTTPLGMHPNIEDCPWPADLPLLPGIFVYDLVYKPDRTMLLRRAQAAGLPNANGLGMLVEQAALAFERWTSLPAPRAVMFQAVQV